jgi:hypothetical protein
MTAPKQLQPWAFKPQERAAAKAAGETMYFTGRPCGKGHLGMRFTSSGTCHECSLLSQKENRLKHHEYRKAKEKARYAKNRQINLDAAKSYREQNPEKVKAANAKSNLKRKPQRAAAEMLRQATKLSATPNWLSKQDLLLIEAYYAAARLHKESIGIVLAVDHIVPLRGKEVCGLHGPWNLCLRTKSDNSKKHNKLTLDAYWPKQTGILSAKSALPWNLKKETQNVNFI